MTEMIPLHNHQLVNRSGLTTKNLSWRGLMTALTSISHGAGVSGNIQTVNTEKVLLPSGRTVRVPYITGNALKHRVIRRPGMDYMLRRLGIKGELSRACVQLLYSGGTLSSGGATLDIGRFLELSERIPLLGLLGGSMGNHIESSRIQVDCATLICRENYEAGRIPARYLVENQAPPASSCRDVIGYTRAEASKQSAALALMTTEQAEATVGAISKAKEARDDGENPGSASRQGSTQMRYESEVIVPGSRLLWGVTLHRATDVEIGAFFSAILEFSQSPYVGGKSSVGHGKVSLDMGEWRINALTEVVGPDSIKPSLDAYDDHLKSQRDKVTETLRGIA